MNNAAKVEGLKFERVVWPYRLMLPFLFVIGWYVHTKKFLYNFFGGRGCAPKTNFWLVDWISINSRRVRDGAARWLALDAVYNFTKGEGCSWIACAIDDYWMHIRNAQAVRNRLKIVKQEIEIAILDVVKTKARNEPVRLLSLAAGSGQGVIEVVAKLHHAGIRCEVLLVDQDHSALAHARKLAWKHGISDMVATRESNAVLFYRNLRKWGFKPDIIEMCGLMDYLEDELAITVIKMIHRCLPPRGFFLTCHIHPNKESYFLWHVVNWGMLYREQQELRNLLVKGGFILPILYTEPHRIHSVAVARKV